MLPVIVMHASVCTYDALFMHLHASACNLATLKKKN